LITPPARLIYLSSQMQFYAEPHFGDLQWVRRPWNGSESYGETKLYDAALAFAIARRWPEILANTMTPGWVPTRMGGAGAPDDLGLGSLTQAWLATSHEPAALVSGRYFYHQQEQDASPHASDLSVQDRLLDHCAELSGIEIPTESA
jgi:NAD(P)-dependent dehydrogenase (short-subunit alcohol dehydrogenase family)